MTILHRADILGLLGEIEQRTTLSIAASRDVTALGPFLAGLHPTSDLVWFNFAVPNPQAHTTTISADDLGPLRELFARKGRKLRFEYFEELWPNLGKTLERAGLKLEMRMPIMVCSSEGFRPHTSPGVMVRELSANSLDATMREYLSVAKQSFGLDGADVKSSEIAEQREYLRSHVYRCAYGRMDGRIAGVGSLAYVNDELAGIGTLPQFRRRGVAAAVSSHLLRQHFRSGHEFAWLSAGDDAARAVYEKIGFTVAGVQLIYVGP